MRCRGETGGVKAAGREGNRRGGGDRERRKGREKLGGSGRSTTPLRLEPLARSPCPVSLPVALVYPVEECRAVANLGPGAPGERAELEGSPQRRAGGPSPGRLEGFWWRRRHTGMMVLQYRKPRSSVLEWDTVEGNHRTCGSGLLRRGELRGDSRSRNRHISLREGCRDVRVSLVKKGRDGQSGPTRIDAAKGPCPASRFRLHCVARASRPCAHASRLLSEAAVHGVKRAW